MIERIESFVDQFAAMGLYPDFHTIEAGVNEPICTINGEQYHMFCSNNYLGLTQHPGVKEAAVQAIQKYGVGPGGSRVISGNVDVIEELEREIAGLTGMEDCLTFPTGYMANIAVFRAVMDPLFHGVPVKVEESVIFSDEFNHGSIVDGCRLSKAKKVVFKHDDLKDLEAKIKENDLPNKLIVTESVFSLDGEIINIPEYVELAKRTGAKLMVDDAHGIGVIGKNGGGVTDHFDCAKDIDILMGCMDKAFGGTGGYLCGSKKLITYLRIASRSSILSSAIPTVAAGSMIKAVELIKMYENEREQVRRRAKLLREKLERLGFKVFGNEMLPVNSVLMGDEALGVQFTRLMWEQKIFTALFRWPAVPEGQSRVRVTLMRGHTDDQVDQFVTAAERAGRQLGLI